MRLHGIRNRIRTTLNVLFARGGSEQILEQIAGSLPQLMADSRRAEYFRRFEQEGVHVLPVHFYSPVPDTRTLQPSVLEHELPLHGIRLNVDDQLRLLREDFPRFRAEYDGISRTPAASPHEYYFENNFFSGTDALVLYCMIRKFRPGTYLEVGSGFSSLLAARALLKNGEGEMVCIEPFPADSLLSGFPGLTRVIEKKVQDVPLRLFEDLRPNDILFIDSTHVSKCGSDVNYLCLEVLPRLKRGVVVHFHDIFLPFEYPGSWYFEHNLFWNEQYLLYAFLLFNEEFDVLFANAYMGAKYLAEMRSAFPRSPWWGGGSFWIRREGSSESGVTEPWPR